MSDTQLKFIGAAALFGLWALLVWTGHNDPDLINAIKYALSTLGLYHAITNLQGVSQIASLLQATPAPPATPPAAGKLPTIPLKETP